MKLLVFLFAAISFSLEVFAQCDNRKPLFGLNCVKSGKMKRADEAFRKTAMKQYGSADSAVQHYLRQSWKNFRQENQNAAMENLNQAWLINREDPEVYLWFGHLVRYAFSKNAAEAEKYYEMARIRDPDHQAEKKSLARLIATLENFQAPQPVIDASAQLIQSFPEYENGLGYKKRAEFYTRMQMPDRAVKDWNEVLKLEPENAESYTGRGYAYFWLQDHKQALADYNKAIALNPEYAEAFANRAQLYTDSLLSLDAALSDIDKALKLDSRKPEFYRIKSNFFSSKTVLQKPAQPLKTLWLKA